MNKGCLLFAHDGEVDYGSQAVLAGALAKKNLGVPVCLVTDSETLSNIKSKFAELPFEHIIQIEKPETNNKRRLKLEGQEDYETVGFINSNRASAFELTPFDRTLIIDTDFLILSNKLNQYWDCDSDFMITPGMLELQENITQPTEHKLSDVSVNLLWATNIMFSKTPEVKMLFDLVEYVKQDYFYFSQLYEFNKDQFRNDFAFTIACHILSGHGIDKFHGELPVPLFYIDTDSIIDVGTDGDIKFLVKTRQGTDVVSHCKDQDVHIMNKRSLLANLDKLMRLA